MIRERSPHVRILAESLMITGLWGKQMGNQCSVISILIVKSSLFFSFLKKG